MYGKIIMYSNMHIKKNIFMIYLCMHMMYSNGIVYSNILETKAFMR